MEEAATAADERIKVIAADERAKIKNATRLWGEDATAADERE
jgi:hypothetical protein